jgi:hypothetical protein
MKRRHFGYRTARSPAGFFGRGKRINPDCVRFSSSDSGHKRIFVITEYVRSLGNIHRDSIQRILIFDDHQATLRLLGVSKNSCFPWSDTPPTTCRRLSVFLILAVAVWIGVFWLLFGLI